MDAFLMKASNSISSKQKPGDIANNEADMSKENFDSTDATLAEK